MQLQANLKTSFCKVSVYYDDLKYTMITETELMTWETLIGLIGNTFWFMHTMIISKWII